MLARQAALFTVVLSLIGGTCYGLSRLMPTPQQRYAVASHDSARSFAQMSPAERAERIAKIFRE
ncbi:hypothetical protein BKE38_27280 [Pseudoroseomonas deserti]|uniref:Uncharacterized protein n=1 Tax=Teichococcus deserti TaxID=1817963 RepID=A0A1V2GUX9_9PROT|nr:hypothetical protein [Pseudoroseomonas deserti]ONG44809.1 hypothetical protein BKE38_27280 [Pseudoroseomonas deserti]